MKKFIRDTLYGCVWALPVALTGIVLGLGVNWRLAVYGLVASFWGDVVAAVERKNQHE